MVILKTKNVGQEHKLRSVLYLVLRGSLCHGKRYTQYERRAGGHSESFFSALIINPLGAHWSERKENADDDTENVIGKGLVSRMIVSRSKRD